MANPFGKPIFSGGDAPGYNPRAMIDSLRRTRLTGPASMPRLINNVDPGSGIGRYNNRTPSTNPLVTGPRMPTFRSPMPRAGAVGSVNISPGQGQAGIQNPFLQAIRNIQGGGSGVSTQVKSPGQATLTNALRNGFQSSMPNTQANLTKFVQDAYARQAEGGKMLDAENKALEKVFSENGGLVDELANSRAQRRAAVLMKTKQAMDRARRQNNSARMMAGNSSYLDRAYAGDLARINTEAAVQDADLYRDDIRYTQGERMGALGQGNRLLRDYLSTSRIPYDVQRGVRFDDLREAEGLAGLEDRNSIYETPEQRLQREIRTAQGMDYLNQRAYA